MSVTPLRREVLLEAGPELAFAVFTDRIGRWWPLADHGVHGADAHVAFVGGRLVETAPDRPEAVWGTVTAWEPPDRVSFSWHPGRPEAEATQVEVTFTASEQGATLVRLEHRDWELWPDGAQARDEYGRGWPGVLDRFGHEVARAADVWTWAALLHSPAASDIGPGGVMADPRFGAHVAFLQRRAAAGELVAAGPLPDEAGSGMTVLRLPGSDRVADIERLATEDDESVASGFFAVQIRPWRVVLHTALPATAEAGP